MSAHVLDWFTERRRKQEREARAALMQELAAADNKNIALAIKLEEAQEALKIMTEARLNADKVAQAAERALDLVREAHAAEVENLKRVVDCMTLASCGRQVFGTAPLQAPLAPEAMQGGPGAVRGRALVQEATRQNWQQANQEARQFIQEAEKYMQNLREGKAPEEPLDEGEYSPTARAIS